MEDKVKVFKVHPKAIVPSAAEGGSAGYDLSCLENFSLLPGERAIVRTGLVMQPPEGYHMELLVRSSLAYKHGIMLTNNVGLIDRSYAGERDEIKIMLFRVPEHVKMNESKRNMTFSINTPVEDPKVHFKAGDRIAQVVFRKTEAFEFEQIDRAPNEDDRGGFGSTGE